MFIEVLSVIGTIESTPIAEKIEPTDKTDSGSASTTKADSSPANESEKLQTQAESTTMVRIVFCLITSVCFTLLFSNKKQNWIHL